MKLAYVTTVYPVYLQKFYTTRPQLATQPYENQKVSLEYDSFAWADFWKISLAPHGYEVFNIFANAKPMQYAWAIENGFRNFSEQDWFLGIAFEQIRRFSPDIMFIDDYFSFSADWIKTIRMHCPSIRLVLGWCSAPYKDGNVFKEYDIVMSCSPEMVRDFSSQGHHSFHLNHAFDERILKKIDSHQTDRMINFSFIGQLLLADNYHVKRAKLLLELVKHINMEIYSPMFESPTQVEQLRPFLKPSVFGLEMFRTLNQSKMTFNSHIDISANSASNMRLFEATGMGTCLITDWKQNLKDFFVPDEEVVTYKSVEECVEKVKWLDAHPVEARKIAVAGQKKTLQQHTYSLRALELDKVIRTALAENVRSKNQRLQTEKMNEQYGYFGDYKNWEEACKDSAGYDSEIILNKVKNALLKVKRGEAVYERDSVLFDKPQYSWPLLSALLWCASRSDNRLNIVDYGGSLGSSYFQNRYFLQHLQELRWNIIEQPNFVECGKEHFEDDQLRFYHSLNEYLAHECPSTILLASVLQYFDEPYAYLQKIIDAGFRTIIFDRTPFFMTKNDLLTVQRVPPTIYQASYPAWFLNYKKFMSFMTCEYNLIAEFQAMEGWNIPDSRLLGFIFERKTETKARVNNFCTLFDSVYLTRGLVMYESLCKTGEVFHLYVVCFDELAYDTLQKLNLAHVTLISLDEFEDDELLQVKPERSKGEYCWTCTSSVIKYCLEHFELDEVTYVDSDLFFFRKPSELLAEFRSSNCSVSLSPHNFSLIYQWQTKTSGFYCVQFMTFKADERGMKMLSWWRQKCIEWCFAKFDQENDRFGDQKYLDNWTTQFEGAYVLKNKGAGAAPWNIQRCEIRPGPMIDGQDIVFFHYHGFKWLNDNRVILAGNYLLAPSAIAIFYEPYIRELHKQTIRVLEIDPSFIHCRTVVVEPSTELDAPKTLLFRAFIENQ